MESSIAPVEHSGAARNTLRFLGATTLLPWRPEAAKQRIGTFGTLLQLK
jgi:hypothetical protein